MAVVITAFLLPGAAGLWADGASGESIQRIAMAVVSLGFVLFGIMFRPSVVAVGAGITPSLEPVTSVRVSRN